MWDNLLIGLAVLVFCVLGSIVWSTLCYTAPPMPCTRLMRAAVLRMLPQISQTGPVYELGAGWGGLAVALARARPDRPVIAVEISPVPALICWLRARTIPNLSVRWTSVTHILSTLPDTDLPDIEPPTLVTYVMGANMTDWSRLAPTQIHWISIHFAVPNRIQTHIQILQDLWRTPVYGYQGARET